ncbi:hypothetical protein [Paraburkholderia sp. J67]|uniref:hypothetical protein n=1 Tax=Paraburkholderia sp. J67 TaxID=2805435 RepID=UPI002ABDA049|nr:hypothetical protein [Paraburkholderia sp. J67]
MKVYANALTLLDWLAQRESASVSEITAAGLMGSRTASDVIQYAIRNGAISRLNGTTVARGSARYRSTGVPLPEPRSSTATATFDGLLSAWGIAQDPPQLAVLQARVYQMSDSRQEV